MMNVNSTLEELLDKQRASLSLVGQDLVIQGPRAALEDTQLVSLIRQNKTAIIERMRRGIRYGAGTELARAPLTAISADCERITADLLPLADVTQEQIDQIVATVSGGVRNVQDIYPLAPLQQGILFHHLMAQEGDPYLLWTLTSFADRAKLDEYLAALEAVIARHDILRTAVIWEGLPEPMQVVWRKAPLCVEEVTLDAAAGGVAQQLKERFHPRRYRLDITRAPLMQLFVAQDPTNGEWLVMKLLHHMALDHATAEVMNAEVEAHMLGRWASLPEPCSFRNFVAHIQRSRTRDEHAVFFRKMLGEVLEPTAPFGLQDARGDGSGISEASAALGAHLSDRIRVRARSVGASAASLFHVAWALVLARTSGRDNPVFGTVLFGRMNLGEGGARILGPLINTLPVLIRLNGVGVEVCVRETHQLMAQLLLHEHAPLTLVQTFSRVPVGTPLFTAVLNYRHSSTAAANEPNDSSRARIGIRHVAGDERNNYPLTLSIDDVGGEFTLNAQVIPSVGPERICAMVQRALEQLVTALETQPMQRVDELDVLPCEERSRLLVDWNNTSATYPTGVCIHDLFVKQAARSPDAVAVIHDDRRLTYQDLDRLANQMAHHLASLGVGPEAIVGLCMKRSLEMVVGLLGILKAGAAYLPLDPHFPASRLTFMLHDSGAKWLVATSETVRLAVGSEIATVILDDFSQLRTRPVTVPATGVGPDNLAYVIYTSGSTGQPKGVLGLHRSVVNRIYSERSRAGADCRYAHKTTISFIDALWELFMPLTCGGVAAIIGQVDLLDPLRFVAFLQEQSITHIVLVPSLLNELLETITTHSADLPALRYCACSGEALPIDTARRFRELLPRAELVNIYGTTEFWDATAWHVILDELADTVLIGRPMTNMRVYVLNDNREPVPIAVAGELYICGDGLARGYVNQQPDATGQRFMPCPFEPGRLMYRTGDQVRWRAEGQLEFLGRVDQQIKIRGFRVEPAEIEFNLRRCPGVSQVAVLPMEDGEQTRLVAYVVPSTNDLFLSVETLREQLRGSVPEFMVPYMFMVVERLPLTPSGKIDRKALPVPHRRQSCDTGYVAPRTAMEQTLSSIWAVVLRVDRVGVHDSFFDLGGNSISAIRMINQATKALGKPLSIRTLFERRTIASLCEGSTENLNRTAFPLCILPISTRGNATPLFCVHGGAGTGAIYGKLTKYLGPDRPLYALQYPGLMSDFSAPASLEDLARVYLDAVREIQPRGPYNFLGWSLGGLIAYEMARQLPSNERAECLYLLSSRYDDGSIVRYRWSEEQALNYLLAIHDLTAPEALSTVDLPLHALRVLKVNHIVQDDYELPDLRRHVDIVRGLVDLKNRYRPKPYDGPVRYLAAMRAPDIESVIEMWTRIARDDFELERFDCGHLQLFSEQWIAAVAEAVRRGLTRTA